MRTPPGVTASDFADVIKQFESAVGPEWVFTSDDDLNTYRDAYSLYLGEAEERVASAAVAPDNVEQVQAIVRIANQHRIPLYTISTGKNLGYGGSAPVYSGSVVLDLKRMNRIIEVNEENAYALVEPGVSYFDLYRYIQEKGLKLWIDCPDPGWGSLMGNALDRGTGYTVTHLRNHFEAHCGMEVVLASGELMRTGMGALPNSETWQQYKTGFGPYIDGMFSQSNFGIVTKMGFWLLPEPIAYFKGQILLSDYKDLIPFVPILNYLENTGIYNGYPDIASPLLGVPQADGWIDMIDGTTKPPPPEQLELLKNLEFGYSPELQAYGHKNKIPYWKCSLTFYGPLKVIQAQWDFAKERLSVIPGVRFEDAETVTFPLTPAQKEGVRLTDFGVPSLANFVMGARSPINPDHPSHGHVWFSPIIPRTGAAVYEANKVFQTAAKEMGVPLPFGFIMPVAMTERAFLCIFAFSISEDPAVNKKTREIFSALIDRCAAKGWGEYRTGTIFQGQVMRGYSFNNNALLHFHETVKDAVDPNGILSAGHYGIWPKYLREKKA